MKRLIYVSIVTLFASAILVSGVFADTPITNPLKWSQPPVWNEDGTINGWDVRSLYPGTLQAVDDWECKNDLPVTDIHWWGSYPGWTGQTPPPVRPTGFHFTMYKDVPVGPNNPYEYSHPGELIWEYQAHAYDEVFVGWDKHPYDPDHVEDAFQYYVDLPAANWFWQGDFAEAGTTNIYWLSIQAKFDEGGLGYMWGWKSRPHYFQDDFVLATGLTDPFPPWARIVVPDQVRWDLAFELTTIPEPGSLLALGSGLVGLIGFAVRRRR